MSCAPRPRRASAAARTPIIDLATDDEAEDEGSGEDEESGSGEDIEGAGRGVWGHAKKKKTGAAGLQV